MKPTYGPWNLAGLASMAKAASDGDYGCDATQPGNSLASF